MAESDLWPCEPGQGAQPGVGDNVLDVGCHDRTLLRLREGARMIPWARPLLFDDELDFITEALKSTAICGGPFIERFEAAFSQFHGAEWHALLVANGTGALELPLRALGIGPGDQVIVPGFAFAAAANMTLACGATPVLADVTDDNWLLDPARLARSCFDLAVPRTRTS